jgi:hypothetical protein
LLNQLHFHNYCYEKREKIKNHIYTQHWTKTPLEIYFWHPRSKIKFKKINFFFKTCVIFKKKPDYLLLIIKPMAHHIAILAFITSWNKIMKNEWNYVTCLDNFNARWI